MMGSAKGEMGENSRRMADYIDKLSGEQSLICEAATPHILGRNKGNMMCILEKLTETGYGN